MLRQQSLSTIGQRFAQSVETAVIGRDQSILLRHARRGSRLDQPAQQIVLENTLLLRDSTAQVKNPLEL